MNIIKKSFFIILFALFLFNCQSLNHSYNQFGICLDSLGQKWAYWSQWDERGIALYSAEKNNDSIDVWFTPLGAFTIDLNGNTISPTKDSSIYIFKTKGYKLKWINGIYFQGDSSFDDGTLYFVVDKYSNKFIYIFGKGTCIMPSGKSIELKMNNKFLDKSKNMLGSLAKTSDLDSNVVKSIYDKVSKSILKRNE